MLSAGALFGGDVVDLVFRRRRLVEQDLHDLRRVFKARLMVIVGRLSCMLTTQRLKAGAVERTRRHVVGVTVKTDGARA